MFVSVLVPPFFLSFAFGVDIASGSFVFVSMTGSIPFHFGLYKIRTYVQMNLDGPYIQDMPPRPTVPRVFEPVIPTSTNNLVSI